MKKSSLILLHTTYWIITLVSIHYLLIIHSIVTEARSNYLEYFLVYAVVALASYYIFYLFLVPKFLAQKKRNLFIIWSLTVSGVISLVVVLVQNIIGNDEPIQNSASGERPFQVFLTWSIVFLIQSAYALVHGFFSTLMSGFVAWFEILESINSKAKSE